MSNSMEYIVISEKLYELVNVGAGMQAFHSNDNEQLYVYDELRYGKTLDYQEAVSKYPEYFV